MAPNSFLQEVLGKVPDAARANVEAYLTENPEVAEALGGFVDAQKSEFSRSMDRLRGIEREQTDWWKTHQPLAELGQKAKDAGFDPATPGTPPALPDDVVRREHLEQREALILPLIGTLSGLAVQHFHEFGEPLDVMALINHPEAVKKGIPAFYAESVAPRREEKRKAAEDKRVSDRAEELVRERMKAMTHPSFPAPVGDDTSPLAALTPAAKDAADVGDMVDMYTQLVAQTR
jgi:hypothetical protein